MSPGEKQTLYTYPCEKFFSKVYFLSRKNFWEKGQDQLGKSAGIVKQPQVGKAVGGVWILSGKSGVPNPWVTDKYLSVAC